MDNRGNVVTDGLPFLVADGVWYGPNDITPALVFRTAVGLHFSTSVANAPSIIEDFTLIDSLTLSNRDSYNNPAATCAGETPPSTIRRGTGPLISSQVEHLLAKP